MTTVLDASIISGPIWWALLVLGPVALGWLVFRRERHWWTRGAPLAAAVGLGTASLLVLVVDVLWHPIPESLPLAIVAWTGLAATGFTLALLRPVRIPFKALAVLVAGGVVLSGAAQVNESFGTYPTVRTALGLPLRHQVDFNQVPTAQPDAVQAPAGTPLTAQWAPPPGIKASGAVTTASIPGTTSGFSARPAWIYLPPAYLSTPRALLPVLVLLPGQPGDPQDWFNAGHLAATMDAYAATHDGLAPVVVAADPLGSDLANPLCVDSPLGNTFSYLSVDVPNWIRSHLQVDPDPRHWAVGGLSFGGTCSLQLALNAPEVYPTFIDISGQDEPTLGDRASTVRAAFGGDAAAFARVNPLDLLVHNHFPTTAGFIVAGADDAEYGPQAKRVHDATTAAGVNVKYLELPGGHTWQVWGVGLERSLPFLASRTGLAP